MLDQHPNWETPPGIKPETTRTESENVNNLAMQELLNNIYFLVIMYTNIVILKNGNFRKYLRLYNLSIL